MEGTALPLRGTVLVTGASSGIGRACALLLDRAGYRVLAGIRSAADGEALRAAASGQLQAIQVDLTEPDSLARCAADVAAACSDRPFLGVVNNAGILVSGPLELLPPEALRRQLEVNVVGQVALIQALLPLLRKDKARIVNIGSTSGRIPSPFAGAYCASKFAWLAISDVLREELRSSGITLSVVEPGVIATPIWQKTLAFEERLETALSEEGRRNYGAMFSRRRALLKRLFEQGGSPDTVAAVVATALTSRRPKERYVVGLGAKLKMLVFPFIPAAVLRWLVQFRNH